MPSGFFPDEWLISKKGQVFPSPFFTEGLPERTDMPRRMMETEDIIWNQNTVISPSTSTHMNTSLHLLTTQFSHHYVAMLFWNLLRLKSVKYLVLHITLMIFIATCVYKFHNILREAAWLSCPNTDAVTEM